LTFGDASSAGTLRDGWPKQLLDPTFSLVVVAFFFFADRAKSAIFALVLASTAESVAAVANIWLIGAAFISGIQLGWLSRVVGWALIKIGPDSGFGWGSEWKNHP